jgi:hypothetical protein
MADYDVVLDWTLGTTGAKTLSHTTTNDSDAVVSKPVSWAVDSDFTIVANYQATASMGTTFKVKVQGSPDGTSWIQLDTSSAGGNGSVITHIYDLDTKGLMPYMRLVLDPESGTFAADKSLKTIVTPHLAHH